MRLYQNGEWFDSVPAGALYEHEFEAVVMQHRSDLFPGFRGFRFDPLLVTPLGNVKPDMILIDEDYRSLVIIEVELASHSLTRHVRPQMEKILAARLGTRHADWLVEREPSLNRTRLSSLFNSVPHSTVLLVNGPTPHWDDGLASLPGVARALIEVFRSVLSHTILRVNGSQPEAAGGVLTGLSSGIGHLKTAYKVHLPSAIDPALSYLDAELEGTAIRFSIKTLGGESYLFSRPAIELPVGNGQLIRASNGNYRIEVVR